MKGVITKNICPKCKTKNSLFICGENYANCSVCCEPIREAKKFEILVDVKR